MPTLNINVKVIGGKRTPPNVEAYYTAVNIKEITFPNGRVITNEQLAQWIADNLQNSLNKFADVKRED